MNDTKAKIPEIGDYVRTVGTLVEIQDVTPPPPNKVIDYIFEDVTAHIAGFINGKKIQDFETFNDFYGKGTAVEHAIIEAKKIARKFGKELEVRVIKITSRTRKRPNREEGFYDKQFVGFKSLDLGCRYEMPEDIEEVVWTSKRIQRQRS